MLTFVLLFTSCRTEVEYNGEITEPMLAVFSMLQAEGRVSCNVQKTRFFLDNYSNMSDSLAYRMNIVKDAIVEYQLNSGEWYQMTFDEKSGNYFAKKSDPYVLTHDSMTIRVTHPQYEQTTASQVFPKSADIFVKDVDVSEISTKKDTINVYRIMLHIAHSADTEGICRLCLKDYNMIPIDIASADILFQELNTSAENNWEEVLEDIFDWDENYISETLYDKLYFRMSDIPEEGRDVVIRAYSRNSPSRMRRINIVNNVYTAESFLYMQSMEKNRYNGFNLIGLEEKVQVFGNFSGNTIGCFGAYSFPQTGEILFVEK